MAAANYSAKRVRLSDYDADIDLPETETDRIDEHTRDNLVTWIDEFTRHYRLSPGALHRAVSYVDRVLSARPPSAAPGDYELRLLAASAVFAAAKHEEWRKLNAADIAWYCGFAASKEVTDMERLINTVI
jgi:cyclin A